MMNLENKVLFRLSKNALARNRRFKDLHKGESCYLFGNGISLKWMDLNKFNDKLSIGCGYLWLHKDFDILKTEYYCEMEPFWFYPLWRNKFSARLEPNPLCAFQRKMQKKHPQISFFTSLSNFFGIRGENVYYVHHFGAREPRPDRFDMDGAFYFNGALDAMIGLAIFMGFRSAYLVGCDYTHSPQRMKHFYEKGKGLTGFGDDYNAGFLNIARQRIDLTTITIGGAASKTLKYVDYRDYTGAELAFRENTELVKAEYLDALTAWPEYSIYSYTPQYEACLRSPEFNQGRSPD